MKKLLFSMALAFSFLGASDIFAGDKAPDLFTVWAAKIKEDNVMKALPKMELCHIKNYLEGNAAKFNQYVKDLEKNKSPNAQAFKDFRAYIDELNAGDDIDKTIASTLKGIVLDRLKFKKWTCPAVQ